MIDKKKFEEDIKKIRKTNPLIHNITNYVAMNFSANALLAFGASPIMAHSPMEMEEIVTLSSALVINIGTLDENWIKGMVIAAKTAHQNQKPWVIDPVGAGASTYRTQTALHLIQEYHPNVIRGNASEIMALTNNRVQSKGVDSSINVEKAQNAADWLAKEHHTTVVISGETDYITNGQQREFIQNGSPIMPKITAMGCTASSMVGTFLSINENSFMAAAHAMAIMGITGETTAEKYQSPGSFVPAFLDNLYQMTDTEYSNKLRQ